MANKKTAAKNTKSKKQQTKQPAKQAVRNNTNPIPVYTITTGLIGLFLSIFMYVDIGGGGIINKAIRSFLCGMFGRAGFFVPVISFGLMIYMSKYRDVKKFWKKTLYVFLTMINIAAIAGIFNENVIQNAFWIGADDFSGGGLLGTAVAVFMVSMFQKIASYIILIITLIILASLVSGVPLFKLMGSGAQMAADSAKDRYDDLRDRYLEQKEQKEDALNVASDFAKLSKKGSFKFEKPEAAALPEPNSKKVHKEEAQEEIEYSNGIEEVFGNEKNKETIKDLIKKKKPSEGFDKSDVVKSSEDIATINDADSSDIISDDDEEQPNEPPAKKRERSITEKEKLTYHEEFDSAMELTVKEYVYPEVKLLNLPKTISGDRREELRRTAENLIRVLDDFGVKAKLLQVTQGPTVTRFEIQPDTGIKLSKIVGLADDIALNLAVSTVLVAPVHGKAAVGIEIPNNSVATVSIREMIESDKFKNAKSKLTVALGKDIGGSVVVGDIAKMPHVLIAGATGSGKSVCINTIIMSILYKASPEEVKLIMVDPKVVELGVYNGIPHLLVPVVTEAKKAAGALNWAVAEMMRRYELFKDTGVRKLESYNELMESRGEPKVPQLVIIIDELADLMMVAAKEVEDYICRLAQLARAAGIHLIIATQRPSVDVITGLIKANIPSRIAFAVSSQVDSRTILDKGGAEKLLGMGDMLYSPMGARETTRVQGAFVSDAEIERVLEFIKENTEPNHYSEDLAEHIERCSTGENGVTPDTDDDDGDALLPDAISLAVELGKISTSMIQRRMGVGYSRAGRIIDQMEARGIISGANGSKPRDVLISHADMNIMSNTNNNDDDDEYDDEYEE